MDRECAMKDFEKSSALLKSYVQRRKKSFPGFSMRKMAHDMNVSSAFLTQVFSGKKSFPASRFGEVARHLALDSYEKQMLRTTLAREQTNPGLLQEFETSDVAKDVTNPNSFSDYALEIARNSVLLKDWYYPALLDLTTCKDFKSEPIWIAKRLGLSRMQVEVAVRELIHFGYLQVDNGELSKSSNRLRVSNPFGVEEIRSFHRKTLDKAKITLSETPPNSDATKTREISSLTVAVNPAHFEAARKIVLDAIHEAAKLLAAGDCTEVYSFSVQLFPLTTNKD